MSKLDALADIDAEKALLGACLISDRAIDVALTMLEPIDFRVPRHQEIFAAMSAQVKLGNGHVDAVTLASVFDSTEAAKYLHELQNATPSTSNAAHYAETIAGWKVRRDLVIACDQISSAQFTEPAGTDVSNLIDHAREQIQNIDMPQRIGAPDPDIDSFIAGVDTSYDWLIPDFLERKDRMLVTAGEGAGKALACDTPIPTPNGWALMGDLNVGDMVFGSDGQPAQVVAATVPWMGDCRVVVFDDGSGIVADAGHLWLTETLKAREAEAQERRRPAVTQPRGSDQRWKRTAFPSVVATSEIEATLHARSGHALNHSIATCVPIDGPDADLPISPYTFGAWLGDGTSRTAAITCEDEQILNEIRSEGWDVTPTAQPITWRIKGGAMRDGFEARIRRMDVYRNKHIPDVYARASFAQRLAVLQGLMDTDGSVTDRGHLVGRGGGSAKCELTLTSRLLAYDALDLIVGLGIKATIRESDARLNGRTVGQRYRIGFATATPVFRLQRKLERLTPLRTRRATLRYITSVEPHASVPVRCIQVARADGIFLAGRNYVPTHNSVLLRQIAVMCAAGIHPWTRQQVAPRNVLLVDLENSKRQVVRGLETLRAKAGQSFDAQRLRVHARPHGIDLTTRTDRRWLIERCISNSSELLVIGPLYRMSSGVASRGDIGGEDAARKVTAALDEVRQRCNVALLLETHAPHADGNVRNLRPFGSSVWLRWPEFGIGLRRPDPNSDDDDTFQLEHWRGPRDQRTWPTHLLKRQGLGSWPWTPKMPTGTFSNGRQP